MVFLFRTDWCIPKHLARFVFDDLPDGATRVQVFPHDTEGDVAEAQASAAPFFRATVRPMRWVPAFPFSLSWLRYVGLDAALVQPPLPAGQGSRGELPGTDRWCRVLPGQSTRRASLAWVDLRQKDDEDDDKDDDALAGGPPQHEHENFWPGLGRWQLGVKLEDCDIEFGEALYWEAPPASRL